jgi:hypothetical protein
MDGYDLYVTNFRVNDTRSAHHDTLYLSHTVHVNGELVASNTVSLGDFNNGDYDPAEYAPGEQVGLRGIVINDPEARTVFMFQLLNAGHANAGTIDAHIAGTAGYLAGIAGGAQVAGSGPIPAGLPLEVFAEAWPWLADGCDGPVAADQLSGPRYVIDTWADEDPTGQINLQRHYPGADTTGDCGDSSYDVTWRIQHYRGWWEVVDDSGGSASPLLSSTGIAAATHHGAVHAFGVLPGAEVTHARTFTGASWYVDSVGTFSLADLPVSAISFNDRLYAVGVLADSTISPLAFTRDGSSWTPTSGAFAEYPLQPIAGLSTDQPIAATVFRDRMYVFARDAQSAALRATSTSDLRSWAPWADVPAVGLPASAAVAAAALGSTICLFGIYQTGKPPETAVVVQNTSSDEGATWSGWEMVEEGLRPETGSATDEPLDVAAAVFRDRVHIATRWSYLDGTGASHFYMAVNSSGDAADWSGWRKPEAPEDDADYPPAATAGLAAVGNHLYIIAPQGDTAAPGSRQVFAY